jgi:hypothetical protein
MTRFRLCDAHVQPLSPSQDTQRYVKDWAGSQATLFHLHIGEEQRRHDARVKVGVIGEHGVDVLG